VWSAERTDTSAHSVGLRWSVTGVLVGVVLQQWPTTSSGPGFRSRLIWVIAII
jgi:hypothetical protein